MVMTRRGVVAAAALLAGLPGAAFARRGEPLMLAREAPADVDPAGYLVSEKFDGARALWDGQRLRFRSGLPVHAPGWFVKRLPAATALDGELWLGRGRFEALSGIVRKHIPVDDEWRAVHYQVFDLPGHGGAFAARAAAIEAIARRAAWPQLVAVAQVALADRAALARRLADVVQGGGEGLVLHRADALWHAGRSDALLKLKPLDDAEATVLGAIKGHGKYATVMGALRVRSDDGREFLLGSGFSDAQRAQPPAVGSVVTYTYRGHTAGGLPRFASFLREREIEF